MKKAPDRPPPGGGSQEAAVSAAGGVSRARIGQAIRPNMAKDQAEREIKRSARLVLQNALDEQLESLALFSGFVDWKGSDAAEAVLRVRAWASGQRGERRG